MKRAAVVAVLAILALSLLVYEQIIATTTFVIILGLAVAVLVYFVFIWPNLSADPSVPSRLLDHFGNLFRGPVRGKLNCSLSVRMRACRSAYSHQRTRVIAQG